VRQVIVVSDGSGTKGVYGPYAGPENAKKAMAQLAALPGMGHDEWTVFPLHELFTAGKDAGEAA
jgi:hypothetical protein